MSLCFRVSGIGTSSFDIIAKYFIWVIKVGSNIKCSTWVFTQRFFNDQTHKSQAIKNQFKVCIFLQDMSNTPVAECSCVCTSMSTADSGAGS